MSAHAAGQTQTIKPTFTPVAHGLLQRCTATQECDDCRKKRLGTLQRAAVNSSHVSQVPPIVHEVLRSPGQPLDGQTRAFMEPRFSHDFSGVKISSATPWASTRLKISAPHDEYEQEAEIMAQNVTSRTAAPAITGYDFSRVRIHTDVKAAESARAVHALAYTVGRDVVFGAGQYLPRTNKGQRLLAHELTHVVQQAHIGDGVRLLEKQQSADSPTSTDPCANAPRTVAHSLLAQGRELRGRTFADRLRPEEERAWARLPQACREDSRQCEGLHSHDPRPRTAWSLSELHGTIHAAMDVPGAPIGTPIYAPIHGVVHQAEHRPGLYGNVVMLVHECPPPTRAFGGRPVTTIYAHMDSISVTRGQVVQAGDQIGTVGWSGLKSPSLAHLHFSVQHVPSGGRPPRRASTDYEERPEIRIRPNVWLRELRIPIAPAVIAEPPETVEPTEPQPEQESSTVLQRYPDSSTGSGALGATSGLVLQRFPAEESTSRSGEMLPFREAQELADCVRFMGDENAAYCRQTVLGETVLIRGSATRLDITAPGVDQFSTATGTFYRFPVRGGRANDHNRPQFSHPQSSMTVYAGAGANGVASVYPAMSPALDRMMQALITEGNEINDQSMKQAVVHNGYRAPEASEGARYLAALRDTIRLNPQTFGALTFPSSLEAMARSELGFTGSPAHRAFQAAVAREPGWNARLARLLIGITAGFKAPRGGSTHHSGLAVDINFPYALNATSVLWHNMERVHNAGALRSAAGVWLDTFAPTFGFDTYNTNLEIWHQEWRDWAGSAADPSATSP